MHHLSSLKSPQFHPCCSPWPPQASPAGPRKGQSSRPRMPKCTLKGWKSPRLMEFFLALNIPKKNWQTDSSEKVFGFSGWYVSKHHRHRVIEGLPAALEGVLSSKSGIQQVKMVDVQPTICFGLFSEFVVFCIGKLHLYTILFECCTFFLFLFGWHEYQVGLVFREKRPRKYRALRKPWICFTPKHTSFLKTVPHSILGEMILAPHPPRHALPHVMIRFKGGDHHGPAGGGKVSTNTFGPNFIGKNEELTWILHNQQECGYDPTKLGLRMVAKFKVFGTANGLIILSRLCKNIPSRFWRITLLWPRPTYENAYECVKRIYLLKFKRCNATQCLWVVPVLLLSQKKWMRSVRSCQICGLYPHFDVSPWCFPVVVHVGLIQEPLMVHFGHAHGN